MTKLMNIRIKIFAAVFCFSAIVAILTQFVILPYLLPQLHAGNGILGLTDNRGDLLFFHNRAVQTAIAFRNGGWSALDWSPFGGPHSTLWGLIYYVTVPKPYVLIPVQAALQALGAVMLFSICWLISNNRKFSLFAILPFALFPTAAFWYTQNHREGLANLGFLLYVYSWLHLSNFDWIEKKPLSSLIKLSIGFGLSFLLMFLSRGSLLEVLYYLSFWILIPFCLLFQLLTKRFNKKAFTYFSVFCALLVFAQGRTSDSVGKILASTASYEKVTTTEAKLAKEESFNFPQEEVVFSSSKTTDKARRWKKKASDKPTSVYHKPAGPPSPLVPFRWQRESWLPASIDRKAFILNTLRDGYRRTQPFAHTSIGIDKMPNTATESLLLIPHAWKVALFAPFPRHWSLEGAMGASVFMRLIGAFEMIIAYLLLPFAAGYIIVHRASFALWVTFILSFGPLTVLGYIITNVGTLHRTRYGFFMLILGIGVIGAVQFVYLLRTKNLRSWASSWMKRLRMQRVKLELSARKQKPLGNS